MLKKLTMKDLITIAMTAAVLGVLFTFLDGFYRPITELLGPVFSAVTFGLYAMSALLPGYIIKKPGAALIGSMFASAINILTGSTYGIHVMVAGTLQGLGAEAGYGLRKNKKFDILTYLLTGIFITIFVSLRDYFVFSLGQNPAPIILGTLAVRVVSATVCGFVFNKIIGTALKKVGLLKLNDEQA